MKKLIFVIFILISILLLEGCVATKPMTQSQVMAKENYKKIKDRNAAYYNKQTDEPDFKPLKSYAVSKRSQYLYQLISLYNKDPNLIPSKLVDPMTDSEFKKIADEEYLGTKRSLKKMRKNPGMPATVVATIMKEAKAARYNPFWLITDLPSDVKRGIIRQDGKTVIISGTEIGGNANIYMRFISLNGDPLEMVMESIVKDIEAFLLRDKGWVYQGNGLDVMYAMTIESFIDLMNQSKQELAEITGNTDYDQTRKKLLELKIKKKENEIASYKKIIKNSQKNKKIYLYMWSENGQSIPHTFSVCIERLSDHVAVFFAKR